MRIHPWTPAVVDARLLAWRFQCRLAPPLKTRVPALVRVFRPGNSEWTTSKESLVPEFSRRLYIPCRAYG